MNLTVQQIENIVEKGVDPNLIIRLKKHWSNQIVRIRRNYADKAAKA